MKILKMIGLVVAVHVAVLTFGFILPGCQSTARTSSASPGKPADPNLSRIDAARAASAAAQPGQTSAPAASTRTPPPSGFAFTGGPVTDFSAPASAVSAPIRPQTAADSPAIAAAESAEQAATLTYTVASGDNPWTIARKFKISHKELLAVNNLTARSTLQIGQKLKIPAKTVSSKPGPAVQPGTTIYKVQPNDSLGSIARRHHVTVEHIQNLNKLSGATIRIGQELLVPSAAVTPAASAQNAAVEPAVASAKGVSITHIVKPGETLGGIAAYYGASSNEIGVANHITNPNFLQAGQKLVINARKNIPAGTPAATPAAEPEPAAAQPAPVAPPPAPAPDGAPPVNPVLPVIDSPVVPAADNPPVNTPQDPFSPPVVLPQN